MTAKAQAHLTPEWLFDLWTEACVVCSVCVYANEAFE